MTAPLRAALLSGLLVSSAFAGGGPNWVDDVKKELAADGLVMAHLINWSSRLYTAATPEQVAKCPEWDQESDPPLSLAQAVVAARSRIRRDSPTFEDLTVYDVRLNQGHLGRWIYTLRFRGKMAAAGGGNSTADFVTDVMMDGTTLERRFGDLGIRPERPLLEEPELTRNGDSLPGDGKQLHDIEKRMSTIIIPEVDFRQANVFDIVDFLDCLVPEYGSGVELSDETRVRLRMGRHVSAEERRALLPPHSVRWSGISDIPLLTFAARDISVLEVLRIMIKVGDLEYAVRGRVVSVRDPKAFEKVDAPWTQ